MALTTFAPGYARPNTTDPHGFDIQVGQPDGLRWDRLGAYMSAEFEWHWFLPTYATIRVKFDHPMANYLSHPRRRVIHIRTERNGIPWEGRVMKARSSGKPGREVLELTCVSNLFWLLRGLAWVNNLFPPEIQIGLTGKQDVMFGPFDFVAKAYVAKVMTRLRKPVYAALPLRYTVPELPDLDDINTLDDLLNIIADATDDLVVLSARFTQLDELFKQTVETQEVGLSMSLWTPVDGLPSPHVFNTDNLARLQSVIDYSSDNFLNFTNPGNILGLTNPDSWGKMDRTGYVFNTHVKRDMRKIQWRTDAGNILDIERIEEHADATRVVIGGKAPEIMNQVIEWGANFAIQLLLNAIAPGLGLGMVVGDLFDNVFFAYQQFWDADLEAELGEHGFGEAFGDNTAAWSLDGAAVGLAALKSHSGSEALRITTVSGAADGRGLTFGADDGSGRRYQCGDIHTLWDRGAVAEQYVSSVKITDNRDGHMVEIVTLGDDLSVRDGWERVMQKLQTGFGTFRGIANST